MRKIKNKNKNLAGIPVISARDAKSSHLLKIGDIARAFDILPSTVNFYTREGILPEQARSRGGYRLYDRQRAIERLKKIEFLQDQKRLSISEIKKSL